MTAPRSIHHITAITNDARACYDLHHRVLGLRRVKKTVNYDDPGTLHLYFGDETGAPGTILTYFPWEGLPPGRPGTGGAVALGLAVPPGSIGFWDEHLHAEGLAPHDPVVRFGETVLVVPAHDGLAVELVEVAKDSHATPYHHAEIPPEYAIRGIHSITLSVGGYERTAMLMKKNLGYEEAGSERERFRFVARGARVGGVVDVLCQPDRPRMLSGAGTIHHVAFRAANDADQLAVRRELVADGLNVSPVLDRTYFHSIYFREPGGTIFEVATDGPGFAVDEDEESLGQRLVLPDWLEPQRDAIEANLPPLADTDYF